MYKYIYGLYKKYKKWQYQGVETTSVELDNIKHLV